MIKIKSVSEQEILSVKENHVLRCFTTYLYHKHVVSQIQLELNDISAELSSGSPSTGVIKVSKDARNNMSPWQNELFAKEHELIQAQDKYIEAMDVVDGWLKNIKNDNHRDIIVEYLINNGCNKADDVAKKCFTTSGNVCKVSQRYITNIARRIY